MKRIAQITAALGVSLLCLFATALAAETPQAGIYDLTIESGFSSAVTVTPQTGSGAAVEATTVTMDGTQVSGFYPNAERLQVTYTGGEVSAQYLILGLSDESGVPTQGNIVYIDQVGAETGTVTFNLYPSRLEPGKTYEIYLSSSASTGITTFTKIASFQYYVPYTLGDVDGDGELSASDALNALQIAVDDARYTWTTNQRLAAEVDGDGEPTATDALFILQHAVSGTPF